MEEDEHSPVPPRRAPPMNSPFVPSVARCASAEAEEKRQVAAARCVIQAANVALFICVTVLRRIIVRSETCEGRGGEGGGGTKQQDARRHTGVLFSRLHARFLYEVVAPSLGIPMAVLEAVLGSANPAGRPKDEPGLICAEAFLHDEGGSADRPSNFDPVARPVMPIYGPLLQAMPGDAPILWFASARTAPTPRHPVTLYAGNLADGSISTIPGRCTLGFIHDLEKLSPDFVTAVLTSVTCGSARRGGLEWGGVPLGADWPSALLTHDMPGTAVLTEWQMATLLCEKAKLFFSTYRARTLPVDGATGEGPALAKGVPAMQLDADTGLLHCRDGRSAAKNELLPPTEEISGELRATLADLYSRLRRQYPKPPGLIGASGAPMDLDEEHDVMPPSGGRVPALPISTIGLSSESRASLKRTCVEAALPLREERWYRRLLNGAAEMGGLAPTRLAQESLLGSVVDSTIDGTLASASIMGNAELQERISQLEKQCEDLMKQFNTQKEHKLRFKSLAQNLEAQLRQAIMDAQTARAVGRDQGAGIGATEPALFEQALADERQRYQELATEAAEYKAAYQRAINAKDDVASEFRVYKEQTTIALRTAEIRSSSQQSLIDSYREQLYDSRAAASALAPTTFLACLSSIIAPCLRLQGKSHNLQGEFNPFRTAHEQAHGSRSSADGPARPAHYAICATARIELP